MIFVWGESGPQAGAEADAMPVPGLPDVEMSEAHATRDRFGKPHRNFISQYYRELPYGWDVLAENLQDPCKHNNLRLHKCGCAKTHCRPSITQRSSWHLLGAW